MLFRNARPTIPFVLRNFLSCKPYTIPKPLLSNAFEEDPILKDCLKRLLPPTIYPVIERDLTCFGERVVTDILELARQCERQKPELEMFDCWGRQKNRLILSDAWKEMKNISAMEGIVSLPYELNHTEFSRLYQLAKLYLYLPSSGLFGCPLAMTDGAAHLLEKIGKTSSSPVITETLKRLTTREPEQFWTSGQLMTEIRGGSDVGNSTETVAVPLSNGQYVLYGFKFFASATDADVFVALARVATGPKGEGLIPGNKGLALFLIKTRDEKGQPNSLRLLGLKNKLGTRQLPTAELVLDGVLADKLSDVGRGIAEMGSMLTMTRYWSSLSSAASVRRMTSLARDYATRREAFGKTLDQHSLHVSTLGQLEMEARAGLLLLVRMSQLLGLQESGKATKSDSDLLRFIVPLSKGFICKRAMPVLSEGLELFGGQGYMEDTGIPGIFRDAQVQPIWEGTTNMQCIDLIRAVSKTEGSSLKALVTDVQRLAKQGSIGHVDSEIEKLAESLLSLSDASLLSSSEAAARDFLMAFGGFYCSALLFDHAKYTGRASDLEIANRYLEQGRSEWSTVPRRLKDGYYSASKLDAVREAIFSNHKKIVEDQTCSKGEACCSANH